MRPGQMWGVVYISDGTLFTNQLFTSRAKAREYKNGISGVTVRPAVLNIYQR